MGYISKELLLKAYKELSYLTEDHLQGQTQTVSEIRHMFAFDMFFKEKEKSCDLFRKEDKDLFVGNVRYIVNIENDDYTVNFFTNIKTIADCGVGSNFTSSGVVNNSRHNTIQKYEYPTRGQHPLFNVQNGVILRNASYLGNIKYYLSNEKISAAFAIWLLRGRNILELSPTAIKDSLYSFLTKDLVDEFLPNEEVLSDFIKGYPMSELLPSLSVNDIKSLFVIDATINKTHKQLAKNRPFLPAIRTKPFILLAGISGTGKSRIVRKLAQATDDIDNFANDEERFSCHTPSNFCLIQVKPNWHNSMDVVGFKSNIGGEHYEYTPFIEFIAKAWQHQNTPFFLCLDEMNLAPVEEYFAEFLSAIESRSVGSDGEYETDPIIKPFDGFGETVRNEMLNRLIGTVNASDIDPNSEKGKLVKRFRENGLTLPKNLIVMGTVNMDETTFSFSRKVLDRAMSIEMNEVNYDEFLNGTTDNDIPVLVDRNHDLVERFVKAQQVKDFIDAEEVKNFLVSVNALLEGTPFKLGYRAANEAMLYVAAAKTFGNDNLASALDDFTMMKILSRIEGDESKLRTKDGDELLDKLYELFEKRFSGLGKSKTLAKLEQMQHDLKRDHFVSFWG